MDGGARKPVDSRPASEIAAEPAPGPVQGRPSRPTGDRVGDRVRRDAWFARRQAGVCLRFEVDHPGRAMFIDVGPGPEPCWLPRGEAIPYYHALRILVRCEADLSRIQVAARACHQRASGVSAEAARCWLRAAELCEQAIEEFLDSGAATDAGTSRRLMIRARFLVSNWGTGWLLSHHEAAAALAALDQALAAADTTDADAEATDDAESDDADVQAGIGE